MDRTTARPSLLAVRDRSVISSDAYDPDSDRSAPARAVAPLQTSSPNDHRMLEILGGLPLAGETHLEAFRRKERSLMEAFAALTPAESLYLERRLTNLARGDVLAARFATLVPDRRARLLGFLARTRWSRSIASSP